MGWLIALCILIVLTFLPIGVSCLFDGNGPFVRLIAGPVRFTVYPGKKGKKKRSEEDAEKESASENQKKGEKKKGGSIKEFQPLIKLVLDLLIDFRRKLRVDRLELKVVLAGDDPCDLALNYGKAWSALGDLMPQLENLFVIKNRDLEVECDFTSDQTLIFARLDLTITIGRIVSLSVWHGFRLLREYMKIINQRKGGANI